MKKPIIAIGSNIFTAVILVLASTSSMATTVIGMDIDKIIAGAELIFEGEVIASQTQQDNGNIISTYVTFRVDDIVKGNYPSDTIELKFMGGALNGRMTEISGLQMPTMGEQGVYFVESTTAAMVNPLLGWSQGHYLIRTDENGDRWVSNLEGEPVMQVQGVSNIPPAIKKPTTIIQSDKDVARGVITESSAIRLQQGLSVSEFKQQIAELIED